MDKLFQLLSLVERKKLADAEWLIATMRDDHMGKSHDHNMGGYTVGFFEGFLARLGVTDNTTLTQATSRPNREKFETYLKHLVEGQGSDYYQMCEILQISKPDDALPEFKAAVKHLKQQGWKFGTRDNGQYIWAKDKP